MIGRFKAWLHRTTAPAPSLDVFAPHAARVPTPLAPRRKRKGVTDMAVAMLRAGSQTATAQVPALQSFSLPKPAPGVVPAGIAMDWETNVQANYAWALQSTFNEGLGFLGYPYLSQLTQRPEYRRGSEILAYEMTRKWVKLNASGEDKAAKIDVIEKAMVKFGIRALFAKMAEYDGFFGRGQIYIDTGVTDDATVRDTPLIVDKRTVGMGSVQAFRSVEPYWSYPGLYNSDDPLKPDFYCPRVWYVNGKTVHRSRLLTFVGREMPDMLKPAYQFGGLSLSQMGKPYVDNWLLARQSVADLLKSFSTMVLSTNMGSVLEDGDGQGLINRVAMFNLYRDNRGAFVVDKDSEELTNVSAPLGTVDKLQAQAQEHMSSVWGIPLVILLGVTPSGLNASSDGEIRSFYAWVKAFQEHLFRPHLTTILRLIQLSELGEVDEGIDFEFVDLWESDAAEDATIVKTQADTDVAYITGGVILPEEARARLAKDPDSPYHGLDMSVDITPPADPSLEGDPDDEDDPDGDKGGGGPPPGQAQDAARRGDG